MFYDSLHVLLRFFFCIGKCPSSSSPWHITRAIHSTNGIGKWILYSHIYTNSHSPFVSISITAFLGLFLSFSPSHLLFACLSCTFMALTVALCMRLGAKRGLKSFFGLHPTKYIYKNQIPFAYISSFSFLFILAHSFDTSYYTHVLDVVVLLLALLCCVFLGAYLPIRKKSPKICVHLGSFTNLSVQLQRPGDFRFYFIDWV